jgi:DNA-binding transcriptional ArsR family regulator
MLTRIDKRFVNISYDFYRLRRKLGRPVRFVNRRMPAGHIGEKLGLPSATLAFHLKELKNAGLATCTRNGRSLIYAAAYLTMNALLEYLTENCCQGDPAACGLAASACTPSTASKGVTHEAPARARVRR